jgi:hypothetical protein
MEIHCLGCDHPIKPGPSNTHIIGPDIEFKCPFCDYKYEGKFTSFLRDQIGGWHPQSPSDASLMQSMARYVELNSSEYYKEKGLRHGKVRNVRDRGKPKAKRP